MLTTIVTALTLMDTQDFSPEALKATVTHLSTAYTTRNTLSEGHKEAAAWLADQYRKIPGVEVEIMKYTLPQGRRVPEPMEAHQVIATIKGESDRIILIGAHLDSLNLSVDPKTGRAPGANDDLSGVAASLEACKAMAGKNWKNTIKFVAFTGEEQGLLGATALAKRATDEGWKLEAVLNNDTVGSSSNLNGQSDPNHIRVFSEEGENHESRELARWIEWKIRTTMDDFRIKLVLRRDRFGRGGDHTPFVQAGFNGVRFIEVHEEYTRQHTPDDLVEHMDFDYLAKVTEANTICLSSLANADPAPEGVRIVRDQSHDTTLRWNAVDGVKYVVYSRDTASTTWQTVNPVGAVNTYKIEKVNKDDHFFAVGAEGGIPVESR